MKYYANFTRPGRVRQTVVIRAQLSKWFRLGRFNFATGIAEGFRSLVAPDREGLCGKRWSTWMVLLISSLKTHFSAALLPRRRGFLPTFAFCLALRKNWVKGKGYTSELKLFYKHLLSFPSISPQSQTGSYPSVFLFVFHYFLLYIWKADVCS